MGRIMCVCFLSWGPKLPKTVSGLKEEKSGFRRGNEQKRRRKGSNQFTELPQALVPSSLHLAIWGSG